MAAIADLITTVYASAQLQAGGRVLTPAQLAALPGKVAEASSAVRRWCGDRDFTRTIYDEQYTPSLDGTVQLRQIPVNVVKRASGGRMGGITVTQSDRSTNVRATVGFTSTGDSVSGLTFTGLALVRTAAGADIEVDVPFAGSASLTLLAAAVNAVGAGWSATVPTGLGAWPSSELVGGDSALSALGSGATLDVFSESLSCRVDRRTGLLSTGTSGGSSYGGDRWGPYQNEYEAYGSSRGRVRVLYDAGFDTVPEAVQQACALTVGYYMDNIGRDLALSSESVGSYSYVLNTAFATPELPKEVRAMLAPWRLIRV